MLSRKFEEQVKKAPHKIAVKVQEESLTYDELKRYGDTIAGLIEREWPGNDPLKSGNICLLFDHGLDMIGAVLGVLKAGKTYVPLSPDYPAKRLSYILTHSESAMILTHSKCAEKAKELALENNILLFQIDKVDVSFYRSAVKPGREVEGKKLAYIMYTSGSSGKPKGVKQTHENVLHFIGCYSENLSIIGEDRMTLFSSFSHDASVMDIYGTLLNGATLYPLDIKKQAHYTSLSQWLIKEGITIWHSVPTLYRYFLNTIQGNENFQKLRFIVLGGEAVLEHDIDMFQAKFSYTTLYNLYGQTESTYNSGDFITTGTKLDRITLGEVIDGVEIFVVDDNGMEVDLFQIGEIIIVSSHVSPGYWKDEESTRKSFIEDWGLGRVYCTGDLGRLAVDGRIEFVGRKDFQVKIRGFRIEIGDVETSILKIEGIREAVVISRKNEAGDNYLCAFIVAEKELDVKEIRACLSMELPEYMIPMYFEQLEKMPLTTSGKIDRKALSVPEIKAGENYIAPNSEIEIKLVGIWSNILGIGKSRISIDSNFFELGGHSLDAVMLSLKIHKEFDVKLEVADIFSRLTIRELNDYIKILKKDKHSGIKNVEEKEYYTLSSAQKRLYILLQLEAANISYNMPRVMSLEGDIDKEKLEKAFKRLISRHESLRTSFGIIDEEPIQRVHKYDDIKFGIEYYDISEDGVKVEEIRKRMDERVRHWKMSMSEASISSITNEFIRPFDLSRAPLLRVGLIKVDSSKRFFILMVDVHHIITDGTSQILLVEEFMALYAGIKLPPLRFRYKDYSQWQQSQVMNEIFKQQEEYWFKEFQGEIPLLNLPIDYSRPPLKSSAGSVIDFELSAAETKALNKLALSEGVTLFMLVLAIYNIFLWKLSSQEEIVVGVPTAGRKHIDLGQVVGMFVNTLALRSYFPGEKTFKSFLNQVKERTLKALANQDYPFEELVGKVVKERHINRNPLFDVMFILQNIFGTSENITKERMGSLNVAPYPYENKQSRFDLVLTGTEREGQLGFALEYCNELFRKETIIKFIDCLKKIIMSVVANPGIKISRIDIMTEEEKSQVMYDFNNTTIGYPKDKVIHELFEEQVEKTPGNIAVMGESLKSARTGTGISCRVHFTYRQLNEESNQLARFLRAKGVKSAAIVGLMIDRSIETMIGILGILKAGGAYIPIDPHYPEERVKHILGDSNASFILSNKKLKDLIMNRSEVVEIDNNSFDKGDRQNLERIGQSTDLVYVIYTSGSTGKPKGVMIEHRSLVNFIKGITDIIDFAESDSILSLTTLSFDIFGLETILPLTKGSRVVMGNNEEQLDPEAAALAMSKEEVTILQVTPSRLSMLISSEETFGRFYALKYLLVGGEAFPEQLLEKAREITGGKIYNLYGPTETTIWSTIKEVGKGKTLNIGKPIANTRVYILGEGRNLQAIGVTGELYISGEGLARGYVNNAELTGNKFIVNPYKKEGFLYCTGDIARWLPDGNIEFLGRKDHQVKIRGFRVELGEIENRLVEHRNIKEAVVICKVDESGDKHICSYIVPNNAGAVEGKLDSMELREYLSGTLPDYMVPSYFIYLQEIPLTPNGKIDREALPTPEVNEGINYIAPRDEVEEKLAEIWSRELGIEKNEIGIDSNFFRLGGQSLKAIVILSKIHKELNVKLSLQEMFRFPTIRGLSKYASEAEKEMYTTIEPAEKKDYYVLSSAQKRLYVLNQMGGENINYNIPYLLSLEEDIDIEKLEATFKKLIHRHYSLRTSFKTIKEEPVQKVHEIADVEFAVEYYKSDNRQQAVHPGEVESIIKYFIRPFDLSRAPLLRVGLIHTPVYNHPIREEITHPLPAAAVHSPQKSNPGDKYLLLVDMHHIITDGMSHILISKEFLALYSGEILPPLRLQYIDFSEWQNSGTVRESIKQQETYWLGKFTGEIPLLNLPTDYPRPVFQSFAGRSIDFELENEQVEKLKTIALEESSTLFMILLSLYVIFLSKISNQEDIVIGTPVVGRRYADLEQIMGVFINTLALRFHPQKRETFREFLKDVNESTLADFENQDYPFAELVEKTAVNRDTSRNPLFDTLFVLQDMRTPDDEIPALKYRLYEYENNLVKFDLTLRVFQYHKKLLFSFDYCTKLFKDTTIKGFIIYFKNVISGILSDSKGQISELEIIAEEEKKQILMYFNDTGAAYSRDKTIIELFDEQVKRLPGNKAVIFEENYLTYGELNRKVNQLAQILREKGVKPESIAAVMVERSIEMIIGIFGILKAGGAYLPLTPGHPAERIRFILKDSNAGILITQGSFIDRPYYECEVIDLEDSDLYMEEHKNVDVDRQNTSAHLAYVMYTSGTTGTPRGVMVEHKNVINLILGLKERIYSKYPANLNISLVSPYVFDASVKQIFGALLLGYSLYIVPEDIRIDGAGLLAFYKKYRIDISDGTPTHLHLLADCLGVNEEIGLSVKRFLIGGEPLSQPIIKRLSHTFKASGIQITNVYGPTECCVDSTSYEISIGNIDKLETIPIGSPMPNQQVYILNRENRLQPVGIPGELCIGGASVARGYLGKTKFTLEKFIKNPFVQGDRLYKTGDWAKWLSDGNIQYLGRIDNQIKIRGFRIEPEEIEKQLLRHDDIREVVVIAAANPEENVKGSKVEKSLCAYIVSDEELTSSELRGYLSIKLPEYMIPSYFILIEKIPLTHNGKLDRGKLPDPKPGAAGEEYAAPRDRLEEKLVEIWAEVLGVGKDIIGIESNFFALGGHSLKAVAMRAKIHKELDTKIPIGIIFKTPTVKDLAEHIKAAKVKKYAAIEKTEEKEYYLLSSSQKALYIIWQVEPDSTSYNLPHAVTIEGKLDRRRFEKVFKMLIERYECLRTSFFLHEGRPFQKIHKDVDFEIKYYDLNNRKEQLNDNFIADTAGTYSKEETIIENFIHSFDLSYAPLLRVGLAKLDLQKHLFLFDMHHIISDEVTIVILFSEFVRLYKGKELPGLRIQYKDFSQWQNKLFKSKEIEKQEAYWLDRFSLDIPVLNMPTDYPREVAQSFEGDRILSEIAPSITDKIRVIMMGTETTFFMVLLAAFNILLSRYAEQKDIIVGTPIAGRTHADLENLVGMFVNTLCMRNYPNGEKSFIDFLKEVKVSALQAYENQDYPFEELVDKLNIPREAGRNPLFDVLFVSENVDMPEFEIKGLKFSPYRFENKIAHLDLVLYFVELNDRINLILEFSTTLFKTDTIKKMLDHYGEIVEQIAANPKIHLKDINLSHDFLAARSNVLLEEGIEFNF